MPATIQHRKINPKKINQLLEIVRHASFQRQDKEDIEYILIKEKMKSPLEVQYSPGEIEIINRYLPTEEFHTEPDNEIDALTEEENTPQEMTREELWKSVEKENTKKI